MATYIDEICEGKDLSKNETKDLFDKLVKGELDPVEIAALLIALKSKGEKPEEIAGAAMSLRESAVSFPRPDYDFADTCGTGGDGSNTINISTAVAIVAAEMGIPIAKHGNRSISSKCGSADVLEMLGVKLDLSVNDARNCLDKTNICFLFAPNFHPGMRFAMPVRQKLKTRTVFNILGPLVNPSKPYFQIMGVFKEELCVPLAHTLGMLGLKSAMVVHGSGLDEIAIHGETKAALLKDNKVEELTISPELAGFKRYPLESIRGGTPEENASSLENILKGTGPEAHLAAVAINAGALAFIFGKTDDLKSGAALALSTIKSGTSYDRLKTWVEVSNGA